MWGLTLEKVTILSLQECKEIIEKILGKMGYKIKEVVVRNEFVSIKAIREFDNKYVQVEISKFEETNILGIKVKKHRITITGLDDEETTIFNELYMRTRLGG